MKGDVKLGYAILTIVPLLLALGVVAAIHSRQDRSHGRPAITRRTCLGDPYSTKAFDATPASDVLYRFLYDATFRRDPATAWGYSTRRERNGMTRAQWATGNIPVVPEAVGVACTVGAKAYGPRKWMAVVKVNATFYMGVVLLQGGRWRIDYLMPVPDVGAPS